jgi:hypothetical protein
MIRVYDLTSEDKYVIAEITQYIKQPLVLSLTLTKGQAQHYVIIIKMFIFNFVYIIKFASDWWFSSCTLVYTTNKATNHIYKDF